MNTQFTPTKTVLPYSQFKDRVAGGQWLVQRKYDGQFTILNLMAGHDRLTILAELVTPKSGLCSTDWDLQMLRGWKGFYVLLCLAAVNGQSFLHEPNGWRHEKLLSLKDKMSNTTGLPLINMVSDYSSLPDVPPGEGLVAHPLDGPWGHMLCVKNRQDYIVEVLKVSARQSVMVIETEKSRATRGGTILASGSVPVHGRAADMILPGTLLKITALGLTDKGMFREPQLDNDSPDSWLVKP